MRTRDDHARMIPRPHYLWRRVLIYTHRWLGIAGCLLFVAWFVSGIVMMYSRMPSLGADERLARLAPLDVSRLRMAPAEAAASLGAPPRSIRLAMFAGRPLYRIATGRGQAAVFADTGESLPQLTEAEALAVAATFVRAGDPRPRLDETLTAPDQWTVGAIPRALFPLYRVALGDNDATTLYVSATSGEAVLKATRWGRRLGYIGAVFHWLYFTPLRRNGPLWSNVIIWLSIAGCVMCLSGLIWGVWRYAPLARYRLKRVESRTPYAGMMRWHHYAGLIFGLTTFTWIFSGLLSMDPWDWHPGTAPTADQREALSGGSLDLSDVPAPTLTAAVTRLVAEIDAREVEIIQVRSQRYLAGRRPSAPLLPRMATLSRANHGTFDRFPDEDMVESARAAMPDVDVEDAVWLDRYDAYYYDRGGELSLPVLRVRFADPVRTWLYVDPRRGAVVRKEERWSRVNRWLYHGFHSLDFPFLYYQRPLWDLVVIALSIGGLASTITALTPAWRRFRRIARRIQG
jgi:hypothetical protein